MTQRDDAAPPRDPADASPDDPAARAKHDAAVALLRSETTWCDGARALVALGGAAGIGPLVAALRSRIEGSRTCLIDALVTLQAGRQALALVASSDPAQRQLGLDVMVLFEADDQLPALARVATDDDDAGLRRAAVTALDQRTRSPAWRATMLALLDSDDPAVRLGVIDSLAADLRDELPAALRARLEIEPDTAVKARLQAVLATAP